MIKTNHLRSKCLFLLLLTILCCSTTTMYASNKPLTISKQNTDPSPSMRVNNSNKNVKPLLDKERVNNFFVGIAKGISVVIEESAEQIPNEQIRNPNTLVNNQSNNANKTKFVSYFTDIQWNSHKEFVSMMQEKGIVKGHNDKFYPNQNVSFYMLNKMLVQSYRARVGYRLDSTVGLTRAEYFRNLDFDAVNKIYLNTAYELGFYKNLYLLKDDKPDLNKIVDGKLLEYIFTTVAAQIPELVDRNYIKSISWNDDIVKKDELSEHLIRFFQITSSQDEQVSEYVFSDTKYHPHGLDAEVLASYGVVNINTDKFYIDNHIYRADFVVMLVNSFLAKKNKTINMDHFQTTNIEDITDKPYTSFVEYAKDKGYIDYLLETKREKEYFYPQQVMTKHEVYYILNDLFDSEINYDVSQADSEYITRGQVSSLFVDSFGFQKTLETKEIFEDVYVNNIQETINENLEQIQIVQNQDSIFKKFVNFLNKL